MDDKTARRFSSKVSLPDPVTGCMEWNGGKASGGYGHMWVSGRLVLAHRVSYIHWVGPIPEGMVIRHRCDNRPCVNPCHLEMGTHMDNVQDRLHRGRSANWQSKRMVCPLGHLLETPNLRPSELRAGKRACLACGRAQSARTYARKHQGIVWTDEQYISDANRRYDELRTRG